MRVKILGMHCANCSKNLQNALTKKDGIIDAVVDITTESADINWNPKVITFAEIADTVMETGFSVFTIEKKMHIGGMHCAACAKRAKTSLEGIPGVILADINITDNSGFIKIAPSYTDLEDEDRYYAVLDGKISEALNKCGFEYIPEDGETSYAADDEGDAGSSENACSVGCSVSDDSEESGKKKISRLFHKLLPGKK